MWDVCSKVVLDRVSLWVQIWGAPFDMVSPQIATDIGGRIGTVEEVEKRRSNDSQSLFMRVRVSISVSKPLRRGCFVSDSDGNRTWLNFKYERLETFCYFCGFVGHDLKHYAGFFAAEKNGATMDLQYGDWLKVVGGRQKTTSKSEGELMTDSRNRTVQREEGGSSELAAQNKAVQREVGGTSKLAAQYNSGLRVTGPVFPEIIPREDTESRDKESDQRVSHGARAEADLEVLEEIDAAIKGVGVIIPDTSKIKIQVALCGKGLIDVAVQEVGVTPNLNIVHSAQGTRTGLNVGSPKLGLKLGNVPIEACRQKKTNRNSCKGNKCRKSTTRNPNVGKDSSPSVGKLKQGTWKRKDGRPVKETLSSCMNIDVGQKHKISFERPDGTEPGRKRDKTIDMLELISTAEVARQPHQAR